jgi:hypothetical protein
MSKVLLVLTLIMSTLAFLFALVAYTQPVPSHVELRNSSSLAPKDNSFIFLNDAGQLSIMDPNGNSRVIENGTPTTSIKLIPVDPNELRTNLSNSNSEDDTYSIYVDSKDNKLVLVGGDSSENLTTESDLVERSQLSIATTNPDAPPPPYLGSSSILMNSGSSFSVPPGPLYGMLNMMATESYNSSPFEVNFLVLENSMVVYRGETTLTYKTIGGPMTNMVDSVANFASRSSFPFLHMGKSRDEQTVAVAFVNGSSQLSLSVWYRSAYGTLSNYTLAGAVDATVSSLTYVHLNEDATKMILSGSWGTRLYENISDFSSLDISDTNQYTTISGVTSHGVLTSDGLSYIYAEDIDGGTTVNVYKHVFATTTNTLLTPMTMNISNVRISSNFDGSVILIQDNTHVYTICQDESDVWQPMRLPNLGNKNYARITDDDFGSCVFMVAELVQDDGGGSTGVTARTYYRSSPTSIVWEQTTQGDFFVREASNARVVEIDISGNHVWIFDTYGESEESTHTIDQMIMSQSLKHLVDSYSQSNSGVMENLMDHPVIGTSGSVNVNAYHHGQPYFSVCDENIIFTTFEGAGNNYLIQGEFGTNSMTTITDPPIAHATSRDKAIAAVVMETDPSDRDTFEFYTRSSATGQFSKTSLHWVRDASITLGPDAGNTNLHNLISLDGSGAKMALASSTTDAGVMIFNVDYNTPALNLDSCVIKSTGHQLGNALTMSNDGTRCFFFGVNGNTATLYFMPVAAGMFMQLQNVPSVEFGHVSSTTSDNVFQISVSDDNKTVVASITSAEIGESGITKVFKPTNDTLDTWEVAQTIQDNACPASGHFALVSANAQYLVIASYQAQSINGANAVLSRLYYNDKHNVFRPVGQEHVQILPLHNLGVFPNFVANIKWVNSECMSFYAYIVSVDGLADTYSIFKMNLAKPTMLNDFGTSIVYLTSKPYEGDVNINLLNDVSSNLFTVSDGIATFNGTNSRIVEATASMDINPNNDVTLVMNKTEAKTGNTQTIPSSEIGFTSGSQGRITVVGMVSVSQGDTISVQVKSTVPTIVGIQNFALRLATL